MSSTLAEIRISVSFYWRYRFEGKTKELACGTWPKSSMPTIRKERDHARRILETGQVNRAGTQEQKAGNQGGAEGPRRCPGTAACSPHRSKPVRPLAEPGTGPTQNIQP
jgi:hypothetical protein